MSADDLTRLRVELDEARAAHVLEGQLSAARAELDAAREALRKINEIRNSIIGLQTMNWSEHVYPLVAALNGAGFDGMPYDEARPYFGSMLERTDAAEQERDKLRAQLAEREAACAAYRQALTEIARWSQPLQDRMEASDDGFLRQWRGCVALAECALSSDAGAALLAELERLRGNVNGYRDALAFIARHTINDECRRGCIEMFVSVAKEALTPAPAAGKEDVPHGVGQSGEEPIPDGAIIKRIAVPSRLEVVAWKHLETGWWDMEVRGYVTDVTNGKPIRVRTKGRRHEPSATEMHDLLTIWFDHELREQLGMNPHAPVEAPVCGKKCDHGSPCLRRVGHPGGDHETQHGCVFYDPPAAGKGPSND